MATLEPDEIDLLDYLAVIVKRRRMILRNTLAVGVLTLLVTLVLPKTYTASTTLLPPDDSGSTGLKGLLANSPASLLDLPGTGSTSSEIFVEILHSRTVGEGVLKTKYPFKGAERDLYEIWDVQSKEDALKRLRKNSQFSSNEQGVIKISVELRDPDLVARVARQFVAELDGVNQEKSLSKAKSSRLYIEEQLTATEQHLKKASEKLAAFQTEYKAVDLEEQTKVAIEHAGEIRGTIMAREVELEVAKQTMKPDNPVILRLQKEIDALRNQLGHLQFGNSVPFEQKKDYFIPFSDVPEVGLEFADLYRQVKVQETVWQLLNQQYYSAKIQEAKDTPTVQVLDEAVPPERKTRPRRTLWTLLMASFSMIVSVFAAFVMEYAEKVKKNQDEFRKVGELNEALKGDYREFKNQINKQIERFRKK